VRCARLSDALTVDSLLTAGASDGSRPRHTRAYMQGVELLPRQALVGQSRQKIAEFSTPEELDGDGAKPTCGLDHKARNQDTDSGVLRT
jgi:hypothetical protein